METTLFLFKCLCASQPKMAFTKTTKIIVIAATALIASTAVVVPTVLVWNSNHTVKINLLYNAGVMIEAKGYRIYVDPVELPDNYSDYPADAILITHPHGDHYQSNMLTLLDKEDTIVAMPEDMGGQIVTYSDALRVNPGDSFEVGPISITCFYMYTFAPPPYSPSHAPESNWTSYLIDIDGFTIFHAGDSGNIPEYSQLQDTVDIALLPLGPGCQTMAGMDVYYVIDTIKPSYFIPIHYSEGADVEFIDDYRTLIELAGCEIVHLSYFSTHNFKI